MLVLIKSKNQEKWSVHKSSLSCRGIEAQSVVLVEPPKTKEDLETIKVCGGEHYILDDLIAEDQAAQEATDRILHAIATRPEKEWPKALEDIDIPEEARGDLYERMRKFNKHKDTQS